jgi:NADPH:quinone reductase-like Zn-dependent oxidoreductase
MIVQELPKNYSTLVLPSLNNPLEVKVIPTLQPGPGSAFVRIIAANVMASSNQIYNGKGGYPDPLSGAIGTTIIGRIAATRTPSRSLWVN